MEAQAERVKDMVRGVTTPGFDTANADLLYIEDRVKALTPRGLRGHRRHRSKSVAAVVIHE